MAQVSDLIPRGEVIGPYRVVRALVGGHGGQARVYEVVVRKKYRHPDTPTHLALKVAQKEYQAALVAEANYLSRFDHPNVVRIFPVSGYRNKPTYFAKKTFTFGERWYYAMELVRGNSLAHHLTRSRTITDLFSSPTAQHPLSIVETVGIARQLADALEHIHAQSVVNLDVKPGNVLFRHRRFDFLRSSVPEVVLADFGIARDPNHPRFGVLGIATPEYMSPEQASEMVYHRYAQLDGRSDIFSLGIVLYEMLTGHLPFEDLGKFFDVGYTPKPPRDLRRNIPQALETIVMRALAQNPAYRYQTAAEVRAALDAVRCPPDWGAVVRRAFAGVTAVACLAGGSYGIQALPWGATPTPTPVVTSTVVRSPVGSPSPSPSPSLTLTPSITPSPNSSPTFTPRPTFTLQPTATPAPTGTPTRPPPTRTQTPTQNQEDKK